MGLRQEMGDEGQEDGKQRAVSEREGQVAELQGRMRIPRGGGSVSWGCHNGTTGWGAQNNRHQFAPSSGSQSSNSKGSAGPGSLWRLQGRSFLASPSFRWVLAVVCVPRLIDTSVSAFVIT